MLVGTAQGVESASTCCAGSANNGEPRAEFAIGHGEGGVESYGLLEQPPGGRSRGQPRSICKGPPETMSLPAPVAGFARAAGRTHLPAPGAASTGGSTTPGALLDPGPPHAP